MIIQINLLYLLIRNKWIYKFEQIGLHTPNIILTLPEDLLFTQGQQAEDRLIDISMKLNWEDL